MIIIIITIIINTIVNTTYGTTNLPLHCLTLSCTQNRDQTLGVQVTNGEAWHSWEHTPVCTARGCGHSTLHSIAENEIPILVESPNNRIGLSFNGGDLLELGSVSG